MAGLSFMWRIHGGYLKCEFQRKRKRWSRVAAAAEEMEDGSGDLSVLICVD